MRSRSSLNHNILIANPSNNEIFMKRFILWSLIVPSLLLETANSFGEELRTAGYDLTHYTIERRYSPDDQLDVPNQGPTTIIKVYSGDQRDRVVMYFDPAFNDYKQPSITYLERQGSDSIDTSLFFFNAPVEFADQYLILLSAGKITRVDGTYDVTRPRGTNPKNHVATKFRLLFDSEREADQE